jgi:hypothetical protein
VVQSNVSRFCCATKMVPERRRREPTRSHRDNSKRMLGRTDGTLNGHG